MICKFTVGVCVPWWNFEQAWVSFSVGLSFSSDPQFPALTLGRAVAVGQLLTIDRNDSKKARW